MRQTYFDFLRGVAIIMVISIHTFDNSMILPDVVLRNIMNCAVPIFLAISGYFLSKKLDKVSYKDFLCRQIPKVYIPCLVFSAPLFLYALLKGKSLGECLLNFFLCGFSVYYFVALIVQYYILLNVLRSVKLGGVIVCALVSICSIGIVEYLLYIECLKIPLLIYAGSFPVWIVFFVLGMFWRNIQECSKRYINHIFVLLMFTTLVLSVMETYFLLDVGCGGYGQKVLSFMFNICAVCWLFSPCTRNAFENIGNHFLLKPFVWLGRKSFFIYLIHCYFIGFIMPRISTSFSWFSETIIVLALSVLSVIVAERFPKRIRYCVGL